MLHPEPLCQNHAAYLQAKAQLVLVLAELGRFDLHP
jgi:hypothetical protein